MCDCTEYEFCPYCIDKISFGGENSEPEGAVPFWYDDYPNNPLTIGEE